MALIELPFPVFSLSVFKWTLFVFDIYWKDSQATISFLGHLYLHRLHYLVVNDRARAFGCKILYFTLSSEHQLTSLQSGFH